jgi:hypothetical protein
MNLNYMTKQEAQLLDNASPANQDRLLGSRIKSMLDNINGGVGNIFYLDPSKGSDSNDGLSPQTAFATLPVAYAALTDNNNDVLIYIARLQSNSTSIYLSSAFTWAKNFTHFIGLCAPTPNARARIYQAPAATGITALFTISGSGCMFKNIQIFQGVNDATSKVACMVTGSRNYFESCHFAGIGNATQDVSGATSLLLDGGGVSNGENRFYNCYIGLDTVSCGNLSSDLVLQGNTCRNVFEMCHIYRYISNANRALVLGATNGIDRFIVFRSCIFQTDSLNQTVTIAQVFNIAASVQGKIILKDCMLVTDGVSGSGAWSSGATGIIFSNAGAPAATAGGGIATKK